MPQAELIGFDTGYFGHCLAAGTPLPERILTQQLFGDVRELAPATLEGVDAVVYLAAISNDPMGEEFAAVTRSVNFAAAVAVATAAKTAGAQKFVLTSSCSVYGRGEMCCERSPVNPLTAYARSKVEAEEHLKSLAGHGFSVEIGRAHV